jgi:subfamily B ATP-binding cassette protein MsbA
MFSLDPILAVGVLVVAPLASLIIRGFSKRTTKAAKGAMGETSNLSTAIMESLDGVKIVKMENREAYEEARVAAVVERRQRHLIKGSNARAMAAPATETFTTVIVAVVFAYAGWRATSGVLALGPFALSPLTAGVFFAFMTSLLMAAQSLRQVANLQTVFSEGLTAGRRLFAALDVAPPSSIPPTPRPCRPATARSRSITSASPTAPRFRPSRMSRSRRARARPSPWSAPRAAARARS